MRNFSKNSMIDLFEAAQKSPRKRSHFNLHANYKDKVQRLFIALDKGSFVDPHYHELPHQWEMFVVIDGVVNVRLYNSSLEIINDFLVGDGQNSKVIEFCPGDIHSVECVSDSALMLEIKEGPFEPEYAKVSL